MKQDRRLAEHPEFGGDWRRAQEQGFDASRIAAMREKILSEVELPTSGTAQSGGSYLGGTLAKGIIASVVAAAFASAIYGQQAGSDAPSEPLSKIAVEHRPAPLPDLAPLRVQTKTEAQKPKVRRKKRTQAAPSTIALEVKQFKRAQTLAEKSEYTEALRVLSVLERTYPQTVLAPDIGLARADYLVRAGRHVEATRQIQALLSRSQFASQKADLLQMLGDTWKKRGRCEPAIAAYENAMKYDMSAQRRESIKAGIAVCKNF